MTEHEQMIADCEARESRMHLRAAHKLGYVTRHRRPDGSFLYEALNVWNPKVTA